MKKIVYYLIVLSIIMLNNSSVYGYEPPSLIISETSGSSDFDNGNAVTATVDGGYIAVGYTYGNDGDVTGFHGGAFDIWVVKYDANGNMMWQKTVGGSGDENGYAIHQMSDGNYLITGYTNSTDGDVIGNHGQFDFWAFKLDVDGNLFWQKCYGGTNREYAIGSDLTADGGFIMIGHSLSFDGDVTGNHGWDYWVVKTDINGEIEWQKCYGGSDLDYGTSVHPTSDGGYILGGQAYSNDGDITDPYGVQDYWIVKTDNMGNLEWQKSLGGTDEEYCNEVIQTADGGYIINGTTYSSDGLISGYHGAGDSWVVKLDNTGAFWWQITLGSSYFDYGNSVREMNSGGYILLNTAGANDGDVSGNHGGHDIWMVKLNYMGDLDWQKCYGGSEWDRAGNGGAMQIMADGGILVTGESSSIDGDVEGNNGAYDLWMFRTTAEGCETVTDLNALSITTNSAMLVWTPKPGGVKYRVYWREVGTFEWNKKPANDGLRFLPGLDCNTTYEWKVRTWCNVYGGSLFSETDTFTTLACRATEINESAIVVYPNPVHEYLMITNVAEESILKIFDLNGKNIFEEIINNEITKINLSEISAGVYILEIINSSDKFTKTIIRE